MRLSFGRKNPAGQGAREGLCIVIVSGSCCIPGMGPFDEQARRVVEQAVSETGTAAQVTVLPVTKAFFGAVSKKVMGELMAMFNQGGKIGLPAVLVNGEVVSYGVPTLEDMKAVLSSYAQNNKEELQK
ncbi:MAG: hypothetical protein EPO21_09910 [Chloroflexota bacterium]|nr:MAG: hypothetical protein EPO21_09910 [Chloroflexota bacterium]